MSSGNDELVKFLTFLTSEDRTIPLSITYRTKMPFQSRWLYHVLAGVIDLDTNSGQITYNALAQLSGMSYRSIIRYVKVLEQGGLITVERAVRGSKIPNIYHLAGKTARVTLRRGTATSPTIVNSVKKSDAENRGEHHIPKKYTDMLDM